MGTRNFFAVASTCIAGATMMLTVGLAAAAQYDGLPTSIIPSSVERIDPSQIPGFLAGTRDLRSEASQSMRVAGRHGERSAGEMSSEVQLPYRPIKCYLVFGRITCVKYTDAERRRVPKRRTWTPWNH